MVQVKTKWDGDEDYIWGWGAVIRRMCREPENYTHAQFAQIKETLMRLADDNCYQRVCDILDIKSKEILEKAKSYNTPDDFQYKYHNTPDLAKRVELMIEELDAIRKEVARMEE
jgi:hypothetical protein